MEFQYLDFDLLLENSEGQYRARVINSPAGKATGRFSVPFDQKDLEIFLLRVGRTRSSSRRAQTSEMVLIRQFGERLFRAVFKDEQISKCLKSSRSLAIQSGMGLRLRLHLKSPELADLPWEYLYDPEQDYFLALSKETPIVRYVDLSQTLRPMEDALPLSILVMIASPSNLPRLDVEDEWRKLQEALAELIKDGRVVVERLEGASADALRRRLKQPDRKYHIFHFIGHGDFDASNQDGVLMLTGESGQSQPINGQRLGMLLRDHRSLRLVVLNSCEGARTSLTDPFAGVAHNLILQGLPAVIAMQFEITDDAARVLAHEFYQALAENYPVDAALAEARRAIFYSGNDLEWGTPVFFSRTQDGRIFMLPEKTKAASALPTSQANEPAKLSYSPAINLEQQVAELYTNGLSAYYARQWERAEEVFRNVLALKPDHLLAAARLQEVQVELDLAKRYEQAQAKIKSEDWRTTIDLLQGIHAIKPTYLDTATLLPHARLRLELSDLYADARRLVQARKWEAGLQAFERIHSLDANYPDPEELFDRLRVGSEQEKAQTRLSEFYTRALQAMENQNWPAAQQQLQLLAAEQPDYRDLALLQRRVNEELARQRQEQELEPPYRAARVKIARQDWKGALELLEALEKAHPGYQDVPDLLAQARLQLQRKVTVVEGLEPAKPVSQSAARPLLPVWVMATSVGVFGLMVLIPLMWNLVLSFQDANPITGGGVWVGFYNYITLFEPITAQTALGVTFLIVILRALMSGLVWLALGWAWRRRLVAPIWLVTLAVASLAFYSSSGTASLWRRFNWIPWMNPSNAAFRLGLVDALHALAFCAGGGLLLYGLLQNRGFDALPPAKFRSIQWAAILVVAASGLYSFNWTRVITNGGPEAKTWTWTFFIYNNQIGFMRFGNAAAASMLCILMLVLIAWGLSRLVSPLALLPVSSPSPAASKGLAAKAGFIFWILGGLTWAVLLLPNLYVLFGPATYNAQSSAVAQTLWPRWAANSILPPAVAIWLFQLPFSLLAAYTITRIGLARRHLTGAAIWMMMMSVLLGVEFISTPLYLFSRPITELDGSGTLASMLPYFSGFPALFFWLFVKNRAPNAASVPQRSMAGKLISSLRPIMPLVFFMGMVCSWWASQSLLWPLIIRVQPQMYTISQGILAGQMGTLLIQGVTLLMAVPFFLGIAWSARNLLKHISLGLMPPD